jgi:Na+-transporting methylmalonyl-CoA/oxaloacetate decarboxylase beta subunit
MSGLIITIIVTLLSPISQWITSTVITPYYFTNVIDYVVEHGQMTQEIAESQFNLGRYILMSAVGALIMGIITSAIVALFISRRKIS